MKKLLSLLTFCLPALTGYSSHMMGGQMTSRNIGGLTYEITNTVYRDTLGIPIALTREFHYEEIGGAFQQINSVPYSGPVNIGNGVEEYIYIDTITFPDTANYSIWIEECCRNWVIGNMADPGTETFHLYNELWADPSNSSPVFLNPPIPVAQLFVPFTYNPLPFDADGDSLGWELDTPLTAGGAYVAGYTLPPADAAGPFTLNPATGEISFLPNMLGHFEVSFVVSEFRGGVKIGEIRRDMQIIVVPSPNTPPLVTSSSTTYPYSGKVYNVAPGSSFSLSISAYDPDGNTVGMTATGEPFMLGTNPAVFTSSLTTPGTTTGTVNWTPDPAQARPAPYIFALRIADYYSGSVFMNDISFSIGVGNFTTVKENSENAVNSIYPNPNNGSFMMELNAAKEGQAILSISNMIGQEVSAIKHLMTKGINLISIQNLNLPKGNYIMQVISDGKVAGTASFEIRD